MALNFPDSPSLNQIYTDNTSGFSYQWNGTVWISYSAASSNNIKTLDDISASFNSSTTIFSLTSGGTAVTPASPQQLIISVGGVMQSPNTDYSVSGSNIIFTTAPQSGLTFFGTLIGPAVPVGVSTVGEVYRRQSYAVTGVQTSFSFPAGYTVGYLEVYRNGVKLISGDDFTATDGSSFSLTTPAQNGDDVEATGYITSAIAVTNGNLTDLLVNNNARVLGITTLGINVGAGQTALTVQGNARVTGILTVGSSSLTLNGDTNQINGVTISAGVVTATSFSGSGSGLTGIVTSVNPVGQSTTSQAGTTTINLSLGSVIYFTHNTDTTVAFANTATTQEITFIRTKDNTTTARAITWPSNIYWDNIDAPTLQNEGATRNAQTFSFTTRDGGVSWVGYEVQRNAGIGTYMYVWGNGASARLGQNNTTTSFNLPKLFENSTIWSNISFLTTTNASLATKTDGTLWAWGANTSGVLGQNTTTSFSSPIQIPGTTWSSIDGGNAFSLATKTDGTLWSWGTNTNGQLGQNAITSQSSPVQIPGTTWSSISIGYNHSLATKTDGTLWTWGFGNSGRLGQSATTSQSSPVQIPGTTWSSISNIGPLAIKTDGTLWSWGYNAQGQLAQNNRTQYSSPVQIPGSTWSSVSSTVGSVTGTNVSVLAKKTDGTLWAWGNNGNGILGQGNSTYYSSPVQIPGTTWTRPISGSAAFKTIT